MKKLLCILLVVCVLMVVGCTRETENEAIIEGLIYDITENTILVVADIESIDIPYDEWFEQGKYAISFTLNDKTKIYEGNKKSSAVALEKGQTVSVWSVGDLLESYPMQGTAVRVEIHK